MFRDVFSRLLQYFKQFVFIFTHSFSCSIIQDPPEVFDRVKSGNWAGQSRTFHLLYLIENEALTLFAVYFASLSCWKTKSPYVKRVSWDFLKCCNNIYLFTCWSIIPLILCNTPTPWHVKHPYTIIFFLCLTVPFVSILSKSGSRDPFLDTTLTSRSEGRFVCPNNFCPLINNPMRMILSPL